MITLRGIGVCNVQSIERLRSAFQRLQDETPSQFTTADIKC